VLKIPFLASYYLISFFPFALDDLQIIKANVAFLLLLPLFFKAIVPLTFCLLSPIAPNVFLILLTKRGSSLVLAVLVVSAILLTFITLYSSSSSTSLLSLLILSLVAN
jgi:hypothetical protein